SAIIRDLKASVDLKETPIIEWRWKVMTLPTGGNACQKSTDDESAQVYVAWLRSPEAVRSRIIGYVWDSTAPAGTICKSQKTSTVTSISFCARAPTNSANGLPSGAMSSK